MKIGLVATCALLLASPTLAAVTVLGGGQAQACFQAAKAGRSDDASIALCDMALETELMARSDRGGTYINRGVMKLRRGLLEPAHGDFDAGIALAPKIGEGWVNRGAMFIGEHRYKDGLQDIDRGLTLGIKEPEKAYYNRAIAYEALDDQTAAYLDYQQAATLKPDWAAPREELRRFNVTRR